MKTYKTNAVARQQATAKTNKSGIKHTAFTHDGVFMMGTSEEIAAFVAELEAAKAVPAVEVAPVAKAKSSTGWIKKAIEYISGLVDLTNEAFTSPTKFSTLTEGKRIWVTVDGVPVFWLHKQDRADVLVAKLAAI